MLQLIGKANRVGDTMRRNGKDAQNNGNRDWLSVAKRATIGYGVIVLGILAWYNSCAGAPGEPDGSIYCMNYNDLGSLLSGIFAPVALVWLAAAVFVQSEELRAQRQELILTRQEYAETRGVLDKQAHALSTNAKLIETQNKIFSDEYQKHLREQSDEKFDELIVNLQYFIANELGSEEIALYSESGASIIAKKAADGGIREPRIMTYSLLKAIDEVRIRARGLTGYVVHFSADKAVILHARLQDIFSMREQLSDPHAAKFAGCHITELNDAVTWLKKQVSGRTEKEHSDADLTRAPSAAS